MLSKKIQTRPTRCKILVVGDMTYRSAYDYSVTQQDMEKARRELNERDSERAAWIFELRKRLTNDSELLYQVDDEYLLCYLRFRKFDVDKAYDTIRQAHSVRIQRPDLFALPQKLEQMYDMNIFNWLPYKDAEGCAVLWHRFGMWNTKQASFNELMQLACGMLDLFTMNPSSQINGIKAIWDFRGFSASVWHISPLMSPMFAWTFWSLWKDCYPERIKLILFVNCSRVVRTALNASLCVMKKKLRDRIKLVGSDVKEIHQYFNPVLLPKDLGGSVEDSECSITEHVMDNLPYLRHMRSLETSTESAPDGNFDI